LIVATVKEKRHTKPEKLQICIGLTQNVSLSKGEMISDGGGRSRRSRKLGGNKGKREPNVTISKKLRRKREMQQTGAA